MNIQRNEYLRYRSFLGESKDFVEKFFSSLEEDKDFARYAAMVMLAHVKELIKRGIVSKEQGQGIVKALQEIVESNGETLYSWIKAKGYVFEDVFEALEAYLHAVNDEVADFIAIGRSRNDHVAAVLRLYVRDRVLQVLDKLLLLRKVFASKAMDYRNSIIPYFTHAQIAQCGSAAIYFLSYEHTFTQITELLLNGLKLLNECPLGSGAAAGAGIYIDVESLSKALCFDSFAPPYYATGSRLFILYYLNSLSLLMLELSRFAEDMIMLSNTTPTVVKVPSTHIATSSIMPHKRNLVTMEILRAKTAITLGLNTAAEAIYKGLPYGYNLDFQELNNVLRQAFNYVLESLDAVIDFVQGVEILSEKSKGVIESTPCWSSDVAEYLAITSNTPIRRVYYILARIFKECEVIDKECIRNVLSRLGLSLNDVVNIIKSKPIETQLKRFIEEAWSGITRDENIVKSLKKALNECMNNLLSSM
jgi:argininosuccinate lyase